MTQPKNTPGSESRDLLAGIYGESPALGLTDASAFEATRDLLHDSINAPLPTAARERFLAAIATELRSPAEPAARAAALREVLWITRPQTASEVPATAQTDIEEGALLRVPANGRARVALQDGSVLLLAGGSVLSIGRREGSKPAAELRVGKVFASVAHQPAQPFFLATPRGDIRVLGTEFEVTLADAALELFVRSGSVQFAAGPVLTANHLLIQPAAGEPRTRRLSLKEAAARTCWAGDESKGRISGPRILLGAIGASAIVLAGIMIGLHSARTAAPPTAPGARPAAVAPTPALPILASTAALAPAPAPGKATLLKGRSEQQANGRWVGDRAWTVEATSALAPDGSRQTQLRMINMKVEAPLGMGGFDVASDPIAAKAAQQPVIVQCDARGNVSGVVWSGAPKGMPAGVKGLILADVALRDPFRLLPRGPVKVGEQWTATLRGTLPQCPELTLDHTSTITFAREFSEDNRTLREYVFETRGFHGGAVLPTPTKPPIINRIRIDRSEQRTVGSLFVDAATGDLLRYSWNQAQLTTVTRLVQVPGKPLVENRVPRQSQRYRATVTVSEGKVTP